MNVSWNDLEPLEEMKEGYEPEAEEIIEYAKYLGLILPHDQKYLSIVKEGLVASLPPFWQACEGPNGELFFRNKKTRKITAENPLDEVYRQKIQDIKRIEGAYGVAEPINEESALRESSGMMHSSRPKRSELKRSSRDAIKNQGNFNSSLVEHQITEESVYSEELSNKGSERVIGKSKQSEEMPVWKKSQLQFFQRIKEKVDSFFPEQWQLITSYETFPIDSQNISKYMNVDQLKELIIRRQSLTSKKQKLQRIREQKSQLSQLYDQLRRRQQFPT